MVEIALVPSGSSYRTHDYVVRNDGVEVFRSWNEGEARFVAIWVRLRGE